MGCPDITDASFRFYSILNFPIRKYYQVIFEFFTCRITCYPPRKNERNSQTDPRVKL